MNKKIFNIFILIVVLFLAVVGLSSFTKVNEREKLPIATIEVENYGKIKVELYPEKAPNTVNNFIALANSGFYDGLTFHRVINKFIIQGGDPSNTGNGGPGYYIKGEFNQNKFEGNDIVFEAGIIAMARSNDNDSAGSQFFITTVNSPQLNNKYAAFGKFIEGMNVLKSIENVGTDLNDKPYDEVKIKSITVDTKGVEYSEPIIIN